MPMATGQLTCLGVRMTLITDLGKKRLLLRLSLVLLAAVLIIPSVSLVAYGSNFQGNEHHSYPLGTVCGDALAGTYSSTQFIGVSRYQGWSAIFVLNNMQLSGGESGTVTASSGVVNATGHGFNLVSASFSNMIGTYKITGGAMKVSFTVSSVSLTAPLSLTVGNPHLPTIPVPCKTLDA